MKIKRAKIKEEFLSACIDAHGLALLYDKEMREQNRSILGDREHSKEWLECTVEICKERREIVNQIVK
jgi:hypothetical protein